MSGVLLAHIAGGTLGLLTGYVALFSPKGRRLHRASGVLFVGAMLVMGLSGAGIAAAAGTEVSAIAGLTTAYLVLTAYTTVRPRSATVRLVDAVATAVALLVGPAAVVLGVVTLSRPDGRMDGLPAFPFFIMGLPSLLGALGDLRMRRSGELAGSRRLARHLWRMSYALLIAAMSFFFGQSDELPRALRHPVLLATPVLAVLLSLLYWMWRTAWWPALRHRGRPRARAPFAASRS